MKKLSVIIPVFNEQNTIYDVLLKVSEVELQNGIEKEIIIVNDMSTDTSRDEIERYLKAYPNFSIRLINHDINIGKGGALQTGIRYAEGDYTIIQDADLELDPKEYNKLLDPVLNEGCDIVYGSRFLNKKMQDTSLSQLANRFLTWFSNFVFNLRITDMETCYKLFDSSMLKSLRLKEKRFGFEPEVTAKIARVPEVRIYEVGISYYGRTYAEGKKINWKDGFRAIYCILKYNIFTSRRKMFKNGTYKTDCKI
jgi:glycosyltransferase involved in cell wall biosynthesis